jgi:hypothetical protein
MAGHLSWETIKGRREATRLAIELATATGAWIQSLGPGTPEKSRRVTSLWNQLSVHPYWPQVRDGQTPVNSPVEEEDEGTVP